MIDVETQTEGRRRERVNRPPEGSPQKETYNVLVLFAIAIACYVNTLTNAFVYDDELQILRNPYIKSWHFLPQIFRTTVWSFIGAAGDTNYYRPLMTLTYLAEWKIFGDSPVGYHLFNIVLHALVVCCVYYAGRELFKSEWIGFLAGLLFAVHPVHTEAVAWIAAVPDLEATLLCLLAFYVYIRSPEPGWKQQLVIVGCFLLALLAKEPALMLAPLLVAYEHFVRAPHGGPWRPRVRRYLLPCVAAVGYLILRIALLGKLAPVLQRAQLSWPEAIRSGFALITAYARLLFWPAKLSAFHVFHPSSSFLTTPTLLGIGIVLSAVGLIALLYKRWPEVAFSMAWIGITLAPVLNARWMAGNVLTERYLYLPSVGFCWIAGWAAVKAWNWLEARGGAAAYYRFGLAACGVGLLAAGAGATWARNRVWKDDLTLYRKTLETDPDSHIMHMNLGVTYYGMRNYAGAEAELRRALELKPDSTNELNALGCVYLEEGRLEEAGESLRQAIAAKPTWTDPHFNYGRVLKAMGQDDAALAEFRKGVELGPVNASARLFLAKELEERGDTAAAEAEYRASVELAPTLEAQRGLADLLLRTGRDGEAIVLLKDLAKRFPFDGGTHLRLGRSLEAQGKLAEAKKEYQAVLFTDPKNSETLSALKRLNSPER